MGPGQNFLPRMSPLFVARVGSAIFGLGLENFPSKSQILQFFSRRVKRNCFWVGQKVPGLKMGQPVIYRGSKVCLDQGPSLINGAKKARYGITPGSNIVKQWAFVEEMG